MKAKQVKISGDTALEYQGGELVGVRRIGQPARGGEQSEPPEDLDTLKVLDLVAFSQAAERMFVSLLDGMLQRAGDAGVPARDVIAESAYRLGISTETAKRYLTKYCAPSAPYAIRGGNVCRKGG